MNNKERLINYLSENKGKLEGETWLDLAKKFKIGEGNDSKKAKAANDIWRRARIFIKEDFTTDKFGEEEYIKEDYKTGNLQLKTISENITTLEDLLEYCKIDKEKYEVTNFWQIYKNGKHHVSALLKKRVVEKDLGLQKETILAELKDIFKDTIDSNSKEFLDKVAPIKPQTRAELGTGDKLLELSICDLHYGKLAWAEESGEDYNIEIAAKRYKDAVMSLVADTNMAQIGRILLPIGNDMLNVDGKTNMTTAGTPQNCDTRFGKMVKGIKSLLIDTIDYLSQYAPVDVLVVPGNHDEQSMFMVGEILESYYHSSKKVFVLNAPTLRKYYQFGQCMLMFTHGNQEKHSDLGLIAATEQAKMWGNTKFREVHLGHFHKTKSISYVNVDEFQGFKIRILPSLSGTDFWHAAKGYNSLKAAEAYVWDAERGLRGIAYYNLV